MSDNQNIAAEPMAPTARSPATPPLPGETPSVSEMDRPVPSVEPPQPGSETEPSKTPALTAEPVPSLRLRSLDAFRGITVLGMLLVNNIALGSQTPEHLTHADWNGKVHLADMVFPWFLLAAGTALPFSYLSHRKRGGNYADWQVKAFSRAFWLFLLGCFVDSTIARQPVFGLGVLQLIGLSSFVAAVFLPLSAPIRSLVAAALLLLYAGMIKGMPFPGHITGVFTEDDNIFRSLNTAYLSPIGLRGLLSVIPASALVLLGTGFGEVLQRSPGRAGRSIPLLLASGILLTALGFVSGQWIPMNKPFWTPPYILFTAGCGAMALGMLYLLTDGLPINRLRGWAFPLIVAGSNPIFAYLAPIIVRVNILDNWRWPGTDPPIPLSRWLQEWCYASAGRIPGGWLYTLGYIAFWWMILWLLYRKRLFLRL